MFLSVKGLAIEQEQMGGNGLVFQIREQKSAIHASLSFSGDTSVKNSHICFTVHQCCARESARVVYAMLQVGILKTCRILAV
jgi:hypothetical protein